MSFSAGTFSINSSGQPVVAGTTISSVAFNALTADLATGLSTCILKDGSQTATASVPFAQGISVGTAGQVTISSAGVVTVIAAVTVASVAAVHSMSTDGGGQWVLGLSNANAANTAGLGIRYTAYAPNGAGNNFLYCEDSAALRASIRSNGGLANFSANDVNLSDASVKIIKGATVDHTAFVESLLYQNFKYIDDAAQRDVDGLIAQDVQALAPELVTEFNAGLSGVYENQVQQRINSVIPRLIARVKALEARP